MVVIPDNEEPEELEEDDPEPLIDVSEAATITNSQPMVRSRVKKRLLSVHILRIIGRVTCLTVYSCFHF